MPALATICLRCSRMYMPSERSRMCSWYRVYQAAIDDRNYSGWFCTECWIRELGPPEVVEALGVPLDDDELSRLTRAAAHFIPKQDVGAVLAAARCEDPLADHDVPKRKRLAAALIATNDRDGDRWWAEEFIFVIRDYDFERYVGGVAIAAERLIGFDSIWPIGRAIVGAGNYPFDNSLHLGLAYWGGGTGRFARRAVVLIREDTHESQVELDLEGVQTMIARLRRAERELKRSFNYFALRSVTSQRPRA